jgi:hypothetical protein
MTADTKGASNLSHCAFCKRFPLTHASIERDGVERCEGWERPAAWDDSNSACVLFGLAKDEVARKGIVKNLKLKLEGN